MKLGQGRAKRWWAGFDDSRFLVAIVDIGCDRDNIKFRRIPFRRISHLLLPLHPGNSMASTSSRHYRGVEKHEDPQAAGPRMQNPRDSVLALEPTLHPD